jgi:hypothetical protein
MTFTISGGRIFIDNQDVGTSYSSASPFSGYVIADPPPSGQSFLGYTGDTGVLDNPNDELSAFSVVNANASVTASFSDSPPAIDDTSFATLDGKLDAIYVDTQAMRAGSA